MKQHNQSAREHKKNKVRQGQYFVKSCIFDKLYSLLDKGLCFTHLIG